jgi:hypothetical protein
MTQAGRLSPMILRHSREKENSELMMISIMILKNKLKFLHHSESKGKTSRIALKLSASWTHTQPINAKGLKLLPASPKSSLFLFHQAVQIPFNPSAGADSEFSNLMPLGCGGVIVIY